MTVRHSTAYVILVLFISAAPALARRAPKNKNAALRYWSAFSAMQDAAITPKEAWDMQFVLDGTSPYEDSKFKEIVEKNKLSLAIMARATALPECDWGLDYSLGSEEPVYYTAKAVALGRLNVLYAYHLMSAGNTSAAVDALTAGLRFSHDVANGSTLLGSLVASQLLSGHLRAVAFAARSGKLSTAQKSILLRAVTGLGSDGLDWQSAIDREFDVMRTHFPGDAQASAALTRVDAAYAKALHDPSALPALRDASHNTPPSVARLIPNLQKVIDNKNALTAQIGETRSALK
jgi:hypothetical protein